MRKGNLKIAFIEYWHYWNLVLYIEEDAVIIILFSIDQGKDHSIT
jgi:hypothetical protein